MPQLDPSTSLTVKLAITTFCATAAIVDGNAWELINGGALGTDVTVSINTLWNIRNALVKSTAITAAHFPVAAVVNNISVANFRSNNTIINVLMSLVDETGQAIFTSLIDFYNKVCVSTQSAVVDTQDMRNIEDWAANMSIVTDSVIKAADLKTLCDYWASVKQRMTFCSTLGVIADTTAAAAAAAAAAITVAGDNVTYTPGQNKTANENMDAYLAAAISATGTVRPAGTTGAQILTSVLAVMDTKFTTLTTGAPAALATAALCPQVVITTAYKVADYNNKSSVHASFLLLKALWAGITPDLYVKEFSTTTPLNLLVWENFITLAGILKLNKTVADVVSFLANGTYSDDGTVNSVEYNLPFYFLASSLVSTNPTFSAFHGVYIVLKTLGVTASDAFKECIASIKAAVVSKEGILLKATADLVSPTLNRLRANDFDSVFGNFIKNLPLKTRLLPSLGTVLTSETPANTYLLGTDLPSDIYDTYFINAKAPNNIYNTPAAITATLTGTPSTDILYAAAVAKAVDAFSGSNKASTFGQPNTSFDILYSTCLNAATAVFSNVVSNMFFITQKLGQFPVINMRTGTAPYDAIPDLKDSKLGLTSPNYDNLLGLFAKSFNTPVVNIILGKTTTFQDSNAAQTIFDTLFVGEKVPLNTIISLQPGNWSNGANPIDLLVKMVVAQKIGTTAMTGDQMLTYNQALLDLAKSNLALVQTAVEASETGAPGNKVIILNFLNNFVRNDGDRSVILSLMGATGVLQAITLHSMVGTLTYTDKSLFSFYFKNLLVSDIILGGFAVPTIGNASRTIDNASTIVNMWPTYYNKNVSALVGPDVTVPLIKAEIVLAFRMLVQNVNKQTGLGLGAALSSMIFSPASVQLAYGLSDTQLSEEMSELNFGVL